MSTSLTATLCFSLQIADNWQQLLQLTSTYGPFPTPTQELQILRAYCGAYGRIFAHTAAIPTRSAAADRRASLPFVLQALPQMERSARELEALVAALAHHDERAQPGTAPLLAPAQQLLAWLNAGISTLRQRYELPRE